MRTSPRLPRRVDRGESNVSGASVDLVLAGAARPPDEGALKDQTSLGTLVVHRQIAETVAEAAADQDDEGSAAGLSDDWDAVSGAATAGATVLGALGAFLPRS